MSSGILDREALTAAFDALEAAVDKVVALEFDALTTPERLALLQRCEQVRRRLPAVEHGLINQLARQATPDELGGKLTHAVAEWTLISRAEASRRINEAADLGDRRGLAGEPLPPMMAATAAAQRAGQLGAGQVTVIRRFCRQLPGFVDAQTREDAERHLAKLGSQYRPEQLAGLADHLTDCLNPDGTYSDDDRARRRGLTLGKQQTDGMSELHGWLTPEARAGLEAVLAKLGAPGMCNPYDATPCVDGAPAQEAIHRDTRSPAQRDHDALNAALRALLASGKLGQHNGLPASIIVVEDLHCCFNACSYFDTDAIRIELTERALGQSSRIAKRRQLCTRSGATRYGTLGAPDCSTSTCTAPMSLEVVLVTTKRYRTVFASRGTAGSNTRSRT